MGTDNEPMNTDNADIYTADGQRVDYINDISDLLWRFDDTPGDRLENPAGTKVRESKRVHDLDSLHDAVREWESEATAPWVGYSPEPEHEGEVCTKVTISKDSGLDDMESVSVHFTRRIKADGDVHMLSVATVLLSVHESGTIAAALAWGEGPRGFTASLGRAKVKDNDRAIAYLLGQVYVMVQRVSSAPDIPGKHAWMVASTADFMSAANSVGDGTPTEYSIGFAADPSDLSWWKRHFDEAQEDAQGAARDEGQP